jgi:hypothetical protein
MLPNQASLQSERRQWRRELLAAGEFVLLTSLRDFREEGEEAEVDSWSVAGGLLPR